MYKKFVPLSATQSPSKNPYEIRTFMGESLNPLNAEWLTDNSCIYERDCNSLENPTVAKVLTLQDQIRVIYQKARENIFLKSKRKKCRHQDQLLTCIVPQRTAEQLRIHAQLRENCLQVKKEMNERVYNVGDLYSNHKSLVELKDPQLSLENQEADENATEQNLPQLASPECSSREFIYVPTKNLLALKRPKSGIFINETERPKFIPKENIPYNNYNPRALQERFDAQNLDKIDLISGKHPKDIWTWNIGLQKRESELDHILMEATIPKFDCNTLELESLIMPEDVHKTFTAHVVFGTTAVRPQTITKKQPYFWRPTEMACLFIAFVQGFRSNADFWNIKILDEIIRRGEKLIENSVKLNYKSPDNDYDIIPQINELKAALNIKLHFAGPVESSSNIYKLLSLYFSNHNVGILCCNNLYLLIWKRCKNLFFVYDPNGRADNCVRDFENGKSVVVSIRFMEHLIYFIVSVSQMGLEKEFKLYEIFLTSYGKISVSLGTTPFPKTFRKQWAVVNESYAVIPGCNNGLFQPTTSQEDNASMLISVMAILYSHIERGNTWKIEQIDELIRLGTAYYKSLRRKLKLKDSQSVTIVDLPDKYVLGTFKASLKKAPFMYSGTLSTFCQKYMDSILISGIQQVFANNWEAALLQIDNCVLGIWRDKELFYVYDAFRRDVAGQVLDPDDYRTPGAPMLQIHANIESLARMLYENSRKISKDVNFFIHAINVGCIKPIMDGKPRKLRYPKLKLTPETYGQTVEHAELEATINEAAPQETMTKQKKSNKKSKKEKQMKVCSIATLPEKKRSITIKSSEVVEPMLDAIICDIVGNFKETIHRAKIYKSAARVLLHSDKEYLERLKYMIKHDEDNDDIMGMQFRQTEQEQHTPIISLEAEINLPSNFKFLPDGSWIIFGSQAITHLEEEQFKLTGLLSSIVTAALTVRYKVSTWTTKLIDYALESVDNFGEIFQTYQYALGTLLNKKIPTLLLGDRRYQLNVEKILNPHIQKSLRQMLIETLINFKRIMVICQRFSCVIVKRYNFLYMFCGFPMNEMGYRSQTKGPGCMLRFIELGSLIRRIEFGCNPQGCEITNYAIIPLRVKDITVEPMGRYKNLPKHVEQQQYNEALDEKSRHAAQQKLKMDFINSELAKEKQRLKDFQMQFKGKVKPIHKIPKSIRTEVSSGELTEFENEEHDVEESVEEECFVEAKHYFSSEEETIKNEEHLMPHPIAYGHRMREKDLLYKIQGSKALQDRTNCTDKQIKPCLFASALATLYVILKPLNEWTSYRIDQIIDSTLILTSKIADMPSKNSEIVMKNVSVDEYIFDILLTVYRPLYPTADLNKQLENVLSLNKYIILQTYNCAYALTKDKYYNLFDPYASMELMDTKDPQQLTEAKRKVAMESRNKYGRSIKLYGERNTASWILFADIKSLTEYLNQRACLKTWKEKREYSFMMVEITSFKKAPQSMFVLQLLLDRQFCNVDDEQATGDCAHNESIAWLEHCLPIWSRLNRKNSTSHYRGMAFTKLKEYDIEIDKRLWSLWGTIHPQAAVFDNATRGKQYLACCVLSLCATSLYRLTDWSANFLDSIIINGDRYLQQSIQSIKCNDYQLTLEDLNVECLLEEVLFKVHIEIVIHGILYSNPNYERLNLAEALMYFFNLNKFGILQSMKKCLAIGFMPGNDGGYFMFDCQSRDHPVFPNGQGSSYILRTKYLQILLYCIVVTLNIPFYNVPFTLHKLSFRIQNKENNASEATLTNP